MIIKIIIKRVIKQYEIYRKLRAMQQEHVEQLKRGDCNGVLKDIQIVEARIHVLELCINLYKEINGVNND